MLNQGVDDASWVNTSQLLKYYTAIVGKEKNKTCSSNEEEAQKLHMHQEKKISRLKKLLQLQQERSTIRFIGIFTNRVGGRDGSRAHFVPEIFECLGAGVVVKNEPRPNTRYHSARKDDLARSENIERNILVS